tara:strand:+ start:1853 stop:2518 length:666 start_codon:yes stop_codon:yes gene_type:complete
MISIENVHPDPITVYTDGACSRNGQHGAKAGYGIYFGQNDSRNISSICPGKQTNNVAELTAIIQTYFILEHEINIQKSYVLIVSDSLYAIRACTSFGEKCAAKGWKDKKPIPNVDLVKQAYILYLNKPNVQFLHIDAHSGKQDKHSIGNYYADLLANRAIGIDVKAAPTTCTKKVYLNVKYEQKEHAKSFGAKWDFKKKKWYIPSDCSDTNRDKLLELYNN